MKLSDYKSKYNSLRTKCSLTGEDALKAISQDEYALLYVNSKFFEGTTKELTVKEVEDLLGYSVKIIK